jgi:hypothetical protein
LTQITDRLVVKSGDALFEFPLETIDRVERPKDRIWNGALSRHVAEPMLTRRAAGVASRSNAS